MRSPGSNPGRRLTPTRVAACAAGGVGVHAHGGGGHEESFGLGAVYFGESTMRPGWQSRPGQSAGMPLAPAVRSAGATRP
jgi:hypothetical protein